MGPLPQVGCCAGLNGFSTDFGPDPRCLVMLAAGFADTASGDAAWVGDRGVIRAIGAPRDWWKLLRAMGFEHRGQRPERPGYLHAHGYRRAGARIRDGASPT
jgi:hypothetical protein